MSTMLVVFFFKGYSFDLYLSIHKATDPKLKVHFNKWTLHTQWQGSLCKVNFTWQVKQDYNHIEITLMDTDLVVLDMKANLEEIFVVFTADKEIILWSTVT